MSSWDLRAHGQGQEESTWPIFQDVDFAEFLRKNLHFLAGFLRGFSGFFARCIFLAGKFAWFSGVFAHVLKILNFGNIVDIVRSFQGWTIQIRGEANDHNLNMYSMALGDLRWDRFWTIQIRREANDHNLNMYSMALGDIRWDLGSLLKLNLSFRGFNCSLCKILDRHVLSISF